MSELVDDLERLAALLEKGLITREQFDQQRDVLMSGGNEKAEVPPESEVRQAKEHQVRSPFTAKLMSWALSSPRDRRAGWLLMAAGMLGLVAFFLLPIAKLPPLVASDSTYSFSLWTFAVGESHSYGPSMFFVCLVCASFIALLILGWADLKKAILGTNHHHRSRRRLHPCRVLPDSSIS